MKIQVARESEDGKTLKEWFFVLTLEAGSLILSFRKFKESARNPEPGEWVQTSLWQCFDLELPKVEVPPDVICEAKQIVLVKIEVDK
jgi:hypothetical protein